MSVLLAVLAQAAIGATPIQAVSRKGLPTLYCRNMVIGVSRSSDISVCKTKAAWADWDSCQGATRYCTPAEKAAMRLKYAALLQNEDKRIVCRMVSLTGSRVQSSRVCLTQREWQQMFDDNQLAARNITNTYSKLIPASGQ
ncbi:hypothetical protein [Sphingomonas sp.]|uniref:hypothetical protein n=1 Tax=Sphingomonas sp. TaxID=28214 RepID=UPI00286C407C|nr:hypothetical protein [Sphingomonas sp.]